MASKLTQKETTMLKDQMRHEEVCVRKYTDYAKRTADATLRGMFYEFAQDEQTHHQTLNGLLSGSPGTAASQGQQQGSVSPAMSSEQFIQGMAEQKLQAGVFGQRRKSKSGGTQEQDMAVPSASQAQPMRSQSESLSGQSQSSQSQSSQSQLSQSQGSQSQQQVNWPEPMPSQTAFQQGSQSTQTGQSRQSNQSGQEASRELIPMFRNETAQEFAGGTGMGENESSILTDMLMTEQFVSGSYDSAIFDSVSPQVRQTLQHIQKDEQKHGQGLRDYMQRKGLGSAQ